MSGAVYALPIEKEFEIEKGQVTLTIAKRYRRGVVPNKIEDKIQYENSNCDEENEIEENYRSTYVKTITPLEIKADDRLWRLKQNKELESNDVYAQRYHNSKEETTIREIIVDDISSENSDTNETIIRKREEIRARILENNSIIKFQTNGDENFESDNSFSDEELVEKVTKSTSLKTLFIPRAHRETLKEVCEIERQIVSEKMEKKQKELERKHETKKQIVDSFKIELILKKEQNEFNSKKCRLKLENLSSNEVNTDDEINDESEFELWRKREMDRLKRDKIERETIERGRLEQLETHSISGIESLQSDKINQEQHQKKERTKMKFLQKYYHKGGYFQEDPDDRFGTVVTDLIYSRDFKEPTEVDNFDKTLLPAVMQVKNFGRRGRTKWTHLVSEDTSNRDRIPAYLQGYNQQENRNYSFEKPKKFKT
jgi:microfibrillar-associated protein 1